MTAIAYRDGVLAADTQCTTGHVKWHAPKIARHKGFVLGAAGNPPPVAELVRWYFQAQGKPTRPKLDGYEFDLLVVTPKRRIELWDQRGRFEPIRYRFWAIGCGAECCLAAMDVGATAVEAVKAAIKYADHCGGRVTTCKL